MNPEYDKNNVLNILNQQYSTNIQQEKGVSIEYQAINAYLYQLGFKGGKICHHNGACRIIINNFKQWSQN